ncbi:MAG: ornithine cyclodeaminase family protein [Tissierellia bacterium]|nr:ornithine cyclodeaminase family protein [Tissierellia bacterium]
MLVLNEKDMMLAADLSEIMDAIEKAHIIFREDKCYLPDRYLVCDNNKIMMYMPCYANGVIGTKMLAEFPENPKKGLPYLSGLMILNNYETGATEAVMKGETLTALRTGAAGGVAIRHFAHENSHSVGLVGCGVQGLYQLIYACEVRDIKSIYLFDAYAKNLEPFIDKLKKAISTKEIQIHICEDAAELLSHSEIVITATQAREPLFVNDAKLLEGKCFVAIGSWQPHMREMPDAIWSLVDNVYTELPFACEESGDLSQPLEKGLLTMDRVKFMGDFLKDKSNGNIPKLGSTRYYKSVGMGIFDLMAAQVIFNKSKEKKIGTEIVW